MIWVLIAIVVYLFLRDSDLKDAQKRITENEDEIERLKYDN